MWEEKNFEEKLSSKIDNIYNRHFGTYTLIKRSDRDKYNTDDFTKMLDSQLCIDTLLKMPSGMQFSVQEKILQYSKIHYQQVTIEYYNNQVDNMFGDFFHFLPQLFLFAYSNKEATEIEQYWIFNTPNLMMALEDIGIQTLKDKYLRQNPPPAQASFFAIPIEVLSKYNNLIMYSS